MNEKGVKFITFSEQFNHSQDTLLKNFTEKVNDFLNNHEILDVKFENKQQVLNNWMVAGVMNYLTYVIKYK